MGLESMMKKLTLQRNENREKQKKEARVSTRITYLTYRMPALTYRSPCSRPARRRTRIAVS